MIEDTLERLPLTVYRYSLVEGKTIYTNRSIAHLVGYTEAEVKAMGSDVLRILMPPEDFSCYLEKHFPAIMGSQDGEVVRFIYRMIPKSGNLFRWYESVDTVVARDANGTPTEIVGYVYDVTDTVQERMVLERTAALVYIFDCVEWRNVWASMDIGVFLGIPPADLHAMGDQVLAQLLHPDDLEMYPQILEQIMVIPSESLASVVWEYRMRGAHGWVWLRDTVRPLEYDRDGKVVKYTGVVLDITEIKNAQAEQIRIKDEMIAFQNTLISQLMVPVIPIGGGSTGGGVLVMPLIGTIDSDRAQHIQESVLDAVARYRTSLVVMDITGVAMVDTSVAQAIIQAAQAVQLLGAQILLTGINPTIASTLVHLGIDLRGIQTRATVGDVLKMPLTQAVLHNGLAVER